MKTGELDKAIRAHKYDGKWGWGVIFARVLLGQLDRDATVRAADVIIPMPTSGPAIGTRQGRDHAGWVVECAAAQDAVGYPFQLDPPLIVKTRPTTRMVSTTSAIERRVASEELYDALVVPDPTAVRGRFIVVYDDVFTGGNSLNAVARRLLESGAMKIAGLTLSRAPWR